MSAPLPPPASWWWWTVASQSRLPGATGTADARSLCGRGRAARSSGTADRPAGWFSSVVLRPQRLQRRSVAMGLLAGDLSETHWALCSAIASATTTTTTTAAVVAAAAAKQLMSSSHTMPGQRKQKQQQKKKEPLPFFPLKERPAVKNVRASMCRAPCVLLGFFPLTLEAEEAWAQWVCFLLPVTCQLQKPQKYNAHSPTHPPQTDGRVWGGAKEGEKTGGRED